MVVGPRALAATLAWILAASACPPIARADNEFAPTHVATEQAAPGGYGTGDAASRRERFLDRPVPAPSGALEGSLGLGYRQGIGAAADGVPLRDLAGAGLALDLEVGLRIRPAWFVGGYAMGVQYRPGDAARGGSARSLAAGAVGAFHFRPGKAMDPWGSVGSGFQFLWIGTPAGPSSRVDGLELARLTVGIDYRAVPEFAFGPYVGADLLLGLNQPSFGPDRASGLGVSSFLSAGLSARFDLAGAAVAGDTGALDPEEPVLRPISTPGHVDRETCLTEKAP